MGHRAVRLQLIGGSLTALVLLGAAAPAPVFPQGWRTLSAAEVADYRRKFRQNGYPDAQVLSVRGDFDGDGKADRARILLNPEAQKFGLFVRRAKTARYELLGQASELENLPIVTLWVIKPGRYDTFCGLGGGDPGQPCIPVVRNRWPAISLQYQETSEILYWWTGRKFAEEWLSD